MGVPSGNRVYNIQQVWQHHHEIMRLKLLGLKNKRIAEIVGMTPVMVSNIINSPVARIRLDEMQSARDLDTVDVAKKIQTLQVKAVDYLEDVLEDDTAMTSTRVKVAQDLLDRGGHGAVRRQEILSAHLTSEDIDRIKQRAMEVKTQQSAVDV